MKPHPDSVEEFPAETGKAWDIALSCPVASWYSPVVSFHDRLGYRCGINAFVSTTDRRILHVESASGLALSGTVSVSYTPQRMCPADYARPPAIRPARVAS